MGSGSNVSLIVASLDLKLVRLLRAAMNNGAGAGGLGPLGALPPHAPGARRRIEPDPRIEPRKVHHPDPRIEPRPTIHPEPRIEPPPGPAPVEPEMPCRIESPLQPPWKVLPWEIPVQPPPKIKVVQHRPDVITKGSLIDFFI